MDHLFRLPDGRVIHCPPSKPIRSDAILIHRHMQARRRAAAMCHDYDEVLGVRVPALTPESYSRLFAISSPFLLNKAEANHADVRNYLWLTSALFCVATAEARGAKREALAPFDRMLASTWIRWRLSRAALADHIAAGYAIAIAQIRDIVTETFADCRGSGKPAVRPLPAALEAQLIDTFAREYATWPLATPITRTPLRKLYQLLRCQAFAYGGEKAVEEDPEELRLMGEIISADVAQAKIDQAELAASSMPAKPPSQPCH